MRLTDLGTGSRNRLGRIQRAATGEDRKPAKERLLRGGQEVVTPIERGAQSLLSLWKVLEPARQEGKTALQMSKQSGRRQHVGSRRGELDG